MQDIIIQLMNQFGYLGVFFLIAVENIFPPIPSEVILAFGGFMTTYTTLNIPLMLLFSTLGSLSGAIILYYIGKLLNKRRLIKLISGRLGKVLRLKAQDIEKADHWFDEKGNKSVFFCRFVPIVRSLISIPAGMSDMPFAKFLLYTSVGSAIWNAVLLIIGNMLGDHWGTVVAVMDKFSLLVLVLLLIVVLGFIIFFRHKRFSSKKASKKS